MTRLILTLCLLLAVPGWANAEILATDTFDRSNGGLGANWTTVSGMQNPTIASNVVQPAGVAGAESKAIYSAITWPDNQYSKIQIITLFDSGKSVSAVVRGLSAAWTGYECHAIGPIGSTATLKIFRLDAGAATQLAATAADQTIASGDSMTCVAQGTSIYLLINNVQKLLATDATYASGSAGIGAWSSAVNANRAQLDNWEGGGTYAGGSAASDTWYVVGAGECTYNGTGLASTCAASAGASGAFLGDSTFSNLIWMDTFGIDSGDTLCIVGTHRGTLSPGNSGTISSPITIKGDCASVTAGTITGANVESSWTGPDGNGNYQSGSTYTTPYSVLVDGVVSKHGDVLASLNTGEWYFSGSKVYYHGDPTGHTMEVGVRGANIDGYASTSSYITITGLTFQATRYQSSRASVVFKDCVGIKVLNSTFYSHRGGIDFRGTCTDVLADGNTLTLVSDGIDVNVDTGIPSQAVISNNTVSSTHNVDAWSTTALSTNWLAGVEATHAAVDQECIASTTAGNNIRVYRNTVSYCYTGVYLYATVNRSDYLVHSNTVYRVARHGIIVNSVGQTISNLQVVGNLINGCGSITPDSSYGINIPGSSAPPGNSMIVTNNTIVNCSNSVGLSGDSAGDLIGIFANNISGYIVKFGQSYNAYHINATNFSTLYNTNVNNNIWIGTSGGWRKNSGAYRTTFSAWLSDIVGYYNSTAELLSTNPSESTWATAGFLSLTTPDYRLVAGSSGRRAGTSVGVCLDVRGRACYPDTPDIGAYQATSRDQADTRLPRQ